MYSEILAQARLGYVPKMRDPETIEEYLATAKSQEAVPLFWRFEEIVRSCGPSDVVVRRTIVHWRRNRVFVGAFIEGRRLGLNIDLLRTAEHPSRHSAFHTTKRVITHRLRITHADELDAALAEMVAEAYADVGPGTRHTAG